MDRVGASGAEKSTAMKRPREWVRRSKKPSRPVVKRQGRVLEVFPMSMFEQVRQVRGYIVLPNDIERRAVGVVSTEQRALEGHKPYMKLINVLDRQAVTKMRDTNSVATVVHKALTQQLSACQPLLQKNQDVAFGIALINFVPAGQHSKDESFFLLSQIVDTKPAHPKCRTRRQVTSCGTWVVCCILKTPIPPIPLDFCPMGAMSIVYEATAVAQEYDRYITRNVVHKEDKCTVEPYIPCYKKLCAQIPLKALTRPIPETPYIIFSPPTGKCVEDKEKGGTVQPLSLPSICKDPTPCHDKQKPTTVGETLSLPALTDVLQQYPDQIPASPTLFSSPKQLSSMQ